MAEQARGGPEGGGRWDGWGASAGPVGHAGEDAIRGAAPEVVGIDVEEATKAQGLIAVESLTARLRSAEQTGGVAWTPVAALADVAVGGLLRTSAAGVEIVLCRLLSGVYAYRDGCAACASSFEGAGLQRSPATPGSGVLTCGSCGAHYDVRQAGIDLDVPDRHLEPIPLLDRDGIIEVAVRAPVPA